MKCKPLIQYVKTIPIKRWFLPFMGIFALLIFEEWRDAVRLPIVIAFGSIVIFWNFPFLMFYTNSKPMYYEDIFIDEDVLPNYGVDRHIKQKFETILRWSFICINSLLMGALSEYWLIKTTPMNTYVEILGISGGILKIFQTANNVTGGCLLSVFKYFIRKENNKMKHVKRKKSRRMLCNHTLKHSFRNKKTLKQIRNKISQ